MPDTEQQGPEVTAEAVEDWLVRHLAERLGVPRQEISPDQYIDDLNLDSLDATLIARDLERWLGTELGLQALRHRRSLRDLARHLARAHLLAQHGLDD